MAGVSKEAALQKEAKPPAAKENDEPKLIQAQVQEEPAAPTTAQKIRQIIHENVLLQHFVFIPVVIFVSYFIGGIIVWPAFLGLSVYLSITKLKERKQHVYDFFEESLKDDDVEEVQEVAWLNQIITKYYASCVPALVKPHIDNVSKTLSDAKPPFMNKLEVGKWSFGRKGPRLQQIRAPHEPDTSKYVLDGQVAFTPDFSLELKIGLRLMVVKILLSRLVFKGRLKVRFNLNEENPNASIVSVCFVGDPQIGFNIMPMGADISAIVGKLYEWLNDVIMDAIRPMMVWPQKLEFTLGAGEVVSEHLLEKPVTDIAIIDADELSEPSGYLLLEKVLNGSLPANLNQGTGGKNMYLTYRRDPQKPPITALAVICPGLGEAVPDGFTVIKKTPSDLSANLNSGNKGQEMFLCYSTTVEGPPITGLGVMNLSQKIRYDDAYTRLEYTPTGLLANTNKEAKGHPIFLAYRGGSRSYFGHPKAYAGLQGGLLRVHVVEAQDLKVADVGGTSDPFCELSVDVPEAKKPKKKSTAVIDKNLDPEWDEFFIFEARSTDVLTIDVYDYDVVGSNDFLGKIQLPLDTLVHGQEVDQWFNLQLVNQGIVHLRILALDWGVLPTEGKEPEPLQSLVCQGHAGLFGKIGGKVTGGVLRTSSSATVVNKSKVRRSVAEVKAEAKNKPPGEEFIEKKGHAEKLPTRPSVLSQGWKRRWFVVHEHVLCYYRSHKDGGDNTLGRVGLKNGTLSTDETSNEYIFTLTTKAKTLQLRCTNEEEFLEWYHALNTNIHVMDKTPSRFDGGDDVELSGEDTESVEQQ